MKTRKTRKTIKSKEEKEREDKEASEDKAETISQRLDSPGIQLQFLLQVAEDELFESLSGMSCERNVGVFAACGLVAGLCCANFC